MPTVLTIASLAGLLATFVFLVRAMFCKGRRMEMFGRSCLCLFGTIAAVIALGATVESEFEATTKAAAISQPAEADADSETATSYALNQCASDYRNCDNEWDFRLHSGKYFAGIEACKAAAVKEALGHADDGYRGMTGVVRFSAETFEQLAYYDWSAMMADDGIVMKDENMLLQVYGNSWAEGRSVCSFNLATGEVDMITVGFD